MTATTVNTKGINLSIGDGATPPDEEFTIVAQITDFNDLPGSLKSKSISVTTLDDEFEQKDGGATKDSGGIKFEILYDPKNASQQMLKAAIGIRKNYYVALPGGTTYQFAGVLTEFTPSGKKDEKIRASVSIDVSGEVTEEVPA